VTALAERLDLTLRRLLPEPAPDEEAREESVEQFSAVVAAEAEVPRTEQALLRRVFAFGETEVKEVMVPRVDIVGIEIDTPWSEVVDRVRASAHARLPVYRETLDDIVGVLYAKDLLPAVIEGEEPEGGWARLVRPAVYLPPTKPIDEHLREARASGTHLAIVVDEYGGTAGLVTVEDILEELVGEIRDETDTDEDEALETEPGRWWVDGGVSLARLSEATGRNFETDGITTVGGLVFALAGRVPRAGETFEVHGFRLVVERVRRRRVARVYLERLPVAEPAEADA
jgi:CBS domain containing-hemolysin-like protein